MLQWQYVLLEEFIKDFTYHIQHIKCWYYLKLKDFSANKGTGYGLDGRGSILKRERDFSLRHLSNGHQELFAWGHISCVSTGVVGLTNSISFCHCGGPHIYFRSLFLSCSLVSFNLCTAIYQANATVQKTALSQVGPVDVHGLFGQLHSDGLGKQGDTIPLSNWNCL
jgi:hypothetical protein